nr:reverse transcriptase domain-containing protein [Tanacetum cinerariifolium]
LLVPVASATTTALSTTFASASSIASISTDDYKIVGVDGQEGVCTDGRDVADRNVAPFPNVDDVELNIPRASITSYGPSHLGPNFPVSFARVSSLLRYTRSPGLKLALRTLELYYFSMFALLFASRIAACSLFFSKRSRLIPRASSFCTRSTFAVLNVGMPISVGMGASVLYVNENGVSLLLDFIMVRLRQKIKNQLVPTTTPLIGFSGEIIWPIGQIQLLVRIGDKEHSASAWMNFVLVRSPSQYNGIIRRPGVRNLQAVPSTVHGMLKLLVERGVITLKSSMLVPLECALVSGPEETIPAAKLVLEERIKVAINPEYPKQVAMIVSTLTEGGRNKLCGLLQHFKDLNKACPEDGYPLPEIDWKVESLCGFPFKCFLDAYKDGSGAGLILTIPEGMEFTYVLRFRFDTTNNEAEYEALIVGIRIAEQMGVKNLQANVDSRLVDNQVNETYVTKEVDMIRYLEKQGIKRSGNKLYINGKVSDGLGVIKTGSSKEATEIEHRIGRIRNTLQT